MRGPNEESRVNANATPWPNTGKAFRTPLGRSLEVGGALWVSSWQSGRWFVGRYTCTSRPLCCSDVATAARVRIVDRGTVEVAPGQRASDPAHDEFRLARPKNLDDADLSAAIGCKLDDLTALVLSVASSSCKWWLRRDLRAPIISARWPGRPPGCT